jgi:hypothetical protein
MVQEESSRHIDSGHTWPVWRTLVRAIPVVFGTIPNGHPGRRSLLLEKGQLRDAVKSSGTQSTHISMIHRRNLSSCALGQCVCINACASLWICGRVRGDADRPERRRVDNPWTAREAGSELKRISSAAHRLTTLSGLSPTYPQAQQQVVF